ncbi:haloacid dehalogenase hydrolase [Strigomonas culicis]|uniref:Haloacid dehalogenase hydrolase n=1 Tax=Strigomonas culicis TaxID=28005 RepID=S9UNA6_9TRYP|nr:haloacid dehalogenase hydrolase [Strigomonas culicis]|eukprot:EPY30199.1 haloacid dehalogenase hydrolase [Strigomonas culicis]
MDGTLLNEHHRLTERTKKVLFDLIYHHGISFVFATGRHHYCVTAVKDDLNHYLEEQKALQAAQLAAAPHREAPGDVYLVSSNGARVHGADGTLVLTHDIPPALVAELYRDYGLLYTTKRKGFVKREGEPEDVVSVSVYTTTQWLMSAMFYSMEEMEEKFGFRPTLIQYPDAPALQNDLGTDSAFDYYPLTDVGKVCFRSFDLELLGQLERDLRARYQDGLEQEILSIAFSSDNCLDVMLGGVSKGSAISEIVALRSAKQPAAPVTLEQVVAFGDSMNDKEMLYTCGKGYYMRNAQQRLKEELSELQDRGVDCEETTSTNTEDGVARTLMAIYELQDW